MTTDLPPDPAAVAAQHKRLIREAIAGYAVMNEVIDQEKREWMQSMSPAESWATFEQLSAFGRQQQVDAASLRFFEQRRIEELLYMRRAFEAAARAQGLI